MGRVVGGGVEEKGKGEGYRKCSHYILKQQRVWQTGADNFESQRCVLNRWVLRACLSEVFDYEVLTSCGRLFQITAFCRTFLFPVHSTSLSPPPHPPPPHHNCIINNNNGHL